MYHLQRETNTFNHRGQKAAPTSQVHHSECRSGLLAAILTLYCIHLYFVTVIIKTKQVTQ